MAPRKRLYKLEDAVEMVFADSPSEMRIYSSHNQTLIMNFGKQKKRESIEKSCKSQEAWPRWVFLFQNDRGRTRVAQQRGEGPNTRATEVHASQGPRASVGHHCTMVSPSAFQTIF
ncbi:hypothetical protein NQZ68_039541 [Dissostichus eleginoides]|nr:hypothetical protein NQZ68_039541 [Dissostichus eleginoides]